MTDKAIRYLKRCMEECSSRLSDPSFFADNSLQANALRIEAVRDMSPRCGEKMPEQWSDGAKRRGWGMWIFSGGSASAFGHCTFNDCPRKREFIQSAPWADIRKLAEEAAP